MSKAKRRIQTMYCVHTGRPSWHQQRAGHISSGVGCYWKKRDAMKYVRNYKKHHPDQPVFVTTSRKVRTF